MGRTTHIVNCVIENRSRILLLKRSQESKYPREWSGISGKVEENEEPLETAFEQIKEQVGLGKDKIRLVKEVDPLKFTGGGRNWIIHMFLFKSKNREVEVSSKYTDHKWMSPRSIEKYDTVPKFKKILELLGLR